MLLVPVCPYTWLRLQTGQIDKKNIIMIMKNKCTYIEQKKCPNQHRYNPLC